MRRNALVLVALVIAACSIGFIWWQRERLTLWIDVRQLANASPEQMAATINELMQREQEAVPLLVRQLETEDEQLARGCGQALMSIMERHGVLSNRTEQIVGVLANRFERFSPAGQNQVMTMLIHFLQSPTDPPSKAMVDAGGQVLQKCTEDCQAQRVLMMQLASWIAKQPQADAWLGSCRLITLRGLSDTQAQVRIAAVQAAMNPTLQLLEQLPKMLYSERVEMDPDVRVMLLLGLGNRESLLPTDQLLTYLHDSEREVREVAQQALRSRGLSTERIRLAQLLTHPDPVMRARVPSQVIEIPDLDASIWLEKLSHDPAPVVRAAVARSAGDTQETKWHSLLQKLASDDPNPTVQQLAEFYLGQNGLRRQ